YFEAAHNGDLATLRCLRRLGCPWGLLPERIFSGFFLNGFHPPMLEWLLEEGYPMNWGEAVRGVARTVAASSSRTSQKAWEWLRVNSDRDVEWWQDEGYVSVDAAMEAALAKFRARIGRR
ncbi:hypothetical protein Agub_g6904, partial [Astrephomene gubernaculifera]